MRPRARKVALAIHLSVSVGWIGAVVAYLVLDVAVTIGGDAEMVRAAWIAMGLIVSWGIVPLALASLLTGLAMALGTKWGLFRHWWVVISFGLTVFAAVVLLSEAAVVRRMAGIAADPSTSFAELGALQSTLPHSVGGLMVLLVVQTLNLYKPRGMTRYGWRKDREEREASRGGRA